MCVYIYVCVIRLLSDTVMEANKTREREIYKEDDGVCACMHVCMCVCTSVCVCVHDLPKVTIAGGLPVGHVRRDRH